MDVQSAEHVEITAIQLRVAAFVCLLYGGGSVGYIGTYIFVEAVLTVKCNMSLVVVRG